MSFPDQQVVYVIRVLSKEGTPVAIQHTRGRCELGIVNIGSGHGFSRLKKLQDSIDLVNQADWNNSRHHQLMLWWVQLDLDSLDGFKGRYLQVAWKPFNEKSEARNCESGLLNAYKTAYLNLPLGNLKTY